MTRPLIAALSLAALMSLPLAAISQSAPDDADAPQAGRVETITETAAEIARKRAEIMSKIEILRLRIRALADATAE